MNFDNCDSYSLVKRFQRLQEERAHTFHLFNEGHKIYLASAPHYDFIRFRQLVHEVTQEFKRISENSLQIERKLRLECKKARLADLIISIQEEEKKKLELTARLQLSKQGLIDHPDEPERNTEVHELKESLAQVTSRINDYLEELRYEIDEKS